MKRIFKAIVLVLLAVPVASLAVANRDPVRFIVDPFIDRQAAMSVEAPLFIYLFVALFTGILIGGAAVWSGQRHVRQNALSRQKEIGVWKREAENLKRGLQAASPAGAVTGVPQPKLRSYL